MTQVGFVLSSEQFSQPELIEFGVAAEQAGFDLLWTSDHFHPWMANQPHAGQAWVLLAALGQRVQRIPFGTGVTCPTFRYHPAIVAQAFASLGLLYPGRVFLGVGSGEALNEQAATGQWGDFEERNERLAEAIELIRRLWTGEWVNHRGKHYTVENARLFDLPAQQVPLYVAASGENAMKTAGKHGDGLITDGKSLSMLQNFHEGARAAGKNHVDQLPVLAETFVVVGGDADALESANLWRFLPKAWESYVDVPDPREILRRAEQEVALEEVTKQWLVSDDPEQHVHGLKKLFDGGATHVFVHSGQQNQRMVIDFYGREVLPRLRGERARSRNT